MKRYYLIVAVIFILISCKNNEASIYEKNEESLNIVTSDIENFWIAYDNLSGSVDSVQVIQKFYLDKASPEFQEFLKVRNFTAEKYVESIANFPNFWASVRPMTERIARRKKELLPFFDKMKDSYPEFNQPSICFAIGTISSGGTTSKGLILIGSEIAAADSTIDKRDFDTDDFMRTVLGNTGDIIAIVAHETIHTQQLDRGNENESLLKRAIIEGGADFVATLLLGKKTINPTTYEYGSQHEESLWSEFYSDLRSDKSFDDTDWFYNYQSNRPADLGYFIGYKICEAYYNNSTNKTLSIKEIIEMENPYEFLEKSGYKENITLTE